MSLTTRASLPGSTDQPSGPGPAGPGQADSPRVWRVAGHGLTLVAPKLGDPRLRVAAVIMSLQVLGQTVLGFKVSIAQILITLGVCGVIDASYVAWRQGVLALPASGMLTGNGVAFILRASGTVHGQWFSLHGIGYFVAAAVLAMGSKYLIRPGGRHIFNPSNVALVWVLLIVGPAHVFPQYLWWGSATSAPVLGALAVILLGALWVLRPVGMVGMATSFLGCFWCLVGALALSGARFFAIWHTGPVSGASYWADIATSPELLLFVFFMMSDPQTAPKSRRGRVIYGSLTAAVAAALIAVEPTEFGIKLGILSSLTLSCALVPLISRLGDHPLRARRGQRGEQRRSWHATLGRLTGGLGRPVVLAVLIIAVAAPADTAALVANHQVLNIERGLTTSHNPQ